VQLHQLWFLFHEAATVQEEALRAAFRPYGMVQNIKVIREKGGEQACICYSCVPAGLVVAPKHV
jgi:hypothetical protein